MPTIEFEYNGKTFQADVDDNFKNIPVAAQQRRLYGGLESVYGLKPKEPKEDKNVLDYLSLLERPAQALKVGVKESTLGGAVYGALGGVDLTPQEGFLTGMYRGWTGQDEIRTQDALPDDMNPILKGVLGFAGDVATDPLTFFGPTVARGIGSGIKAASDATGATPVLSKAGQSILNAPLGKDRQVRDILRNLNVQTGRGKEVKGVAYQTGLNDFKAKVEIALTTGTDDLQNFFAKRAEQLGKPVEEVEGGFVRGMERATKREDMFDEQGNPIMQARLNEDGTEIYKKDANGIDTDEVDMFQMQKLKRDDNGYIEFEDLDAETKALLGSEGEQYVDEWSRLFQDSAKYSEAAGQPINELLQRGYFPRVITKEWKAARKEIDEYNQKTDINFDENAEFDPVFGAGYRQNREEIARDKGLEESSLEYQNLLNKRKMDLNITTPNPVDVPFFNRNPVVAMGSRLEAQSKALQRKWFINEISDVGYGIGPQISRVQFNAAREAYVKEKGRGILGEDGKIANMDDFSDWMSDNAEEFGILTKEERKIGTWLRTEIQDGKEVTTQRILNPAWTNRASTKEQFIWQPLSKTDTDKILLEEGLVKVDSIPDQFLNEQMYQQAFKSAYADEIVQNYANLDDAFAKRLAGVTDDITPDNYKQIVDDLIEEVYPTAVADTKNRLRQLAVSASEKASQSVKGKGAKFYAPGAIKRQIEDTMNVMNGGLKGPQFMKWYDTALNTWKSWSLGVRPAYHSRNVVGNMWNAYMVAGIAPNNWGLTKDAAKLQYYARFGGSESRRQQLVDRMKGSRSAFYKALDKQKIKDSDWLAPNFANTGYSMQEVYDMSMARGVTAGHYTKDTIKELESALAVKTGKGSKFERYVGPDNPVVQTGFAIGGTLEGNARFMVMIDALQKIKKNPGKYEWVAPDGKKFNLGKPMPEDAQYFKTEAVRYRDRINNENTLMTLDDMIADTAGRKVQEALFDYGDLSTFEQSVAKRVMPFYTWTRKNIPAQFKALVQNPERAEKLAIAKQQFEHETGEMDKSDYGKFWGDRVPVFFGNENEGVVKAFALMNLVPMADLQFMLDPKRVIGEMATPYVKAPLEILANYDTFMNRAINSYPGETQDFLGVSLPPKLHHLAKLLVPLGEINRVNPAGVFGENIVDPVSGKSIVQTEAFGGLGTSRESYKDNYELSRWIRFFSGVPSYNVNLARIEYFENKNLQRDVAKLKGKIKWAVRKGENRKLQQLYDLLEAVQNGETDDPFNIR